MLINTKVIINRSRDDVWEFFHNTENLNDWIGGLKAYHHVSGEPGEIGSEGIYEYCETGDIIEMRNEVMHIKKPAEYSTKFHHKDFDMIVNYSFFEEKDDLTTVICNTEYRFRSFFWKTFSKMMKTRMEERQREDMKRLKTFVEMAPVHK